MRTYAEKAAGVVAGRTAPTRQRGTRGLGGPLKAAPTNSSPVSLRTTPVQGAPKPKVTPPAVLAPRFNR